MKQLIVCLFFGLFFQNLSNAQQNFTISGNIKDAETGEDLIGATVEIKELITGTSANVYGFYSITVPKGKYQVIIRFLGYKDESLTIDLNKNLDIDFSLKPAVAELNEVVISASNDVSEIQENKGSVSKLNITTIKKVPAFMGEVDVMRTLQSLPGVQSGGEGTTGFFVRGGSIDQNLVTLDEATIYNSSHLLGFFSVFNADVINDVEIYKGGIPANFGGRLSSVVDIRLRDGNNKNFAASGGLGTIASRFTVEGPIVKDKSSFIVSGRRTYADLFLKMSNDQTLKTTNIYFYDLNGKVNFQLGKKDRIFISAYIGEDLLNFKNEIGWNWGNASATFRWNHIFSNKLFANLTTTYSKFNYRLNSSFQASKYDWKANIKEYNSKIEFTYYPLNKHTVKFGVFTTLNKFEPGIVDVTNNEIYANIELDKRQALQTGIFLSDEFKISEKFVVNAGLRFSNQNLIGGKSYIYNQNNTETIDTVEYSKNQFHTPNFGIEPRVSFNYSLSSNSALKASYAKMQQYLHLVSNNTASIPLDIYLPSNNYLKPQWADQFALGYFKSTNKKTYEFSAEIYYKLMQNQIDFKDNADLLLNNQIEKEILIGKGNAYGIEFQIKKNAGKLNGWISYTLSRSTRNIEGINNNKTFLARQDKPHVLNLVMSYQLTKRVQVGAAWNFSSGQNVTLPTGKYYFGDVMVPVYSSRNDYRLPSNHRLDLSLTIDTKKKEGSKFESSWNISLYNVYARKNPFTVQIRESKENSRKMEAVQLSLIGTIIPSITYNFKF